LLQTGGLVARSARIVLERPLQKLAFGRSMMISPPLPSTDKGVKPNVEK